MCNCKNVKMGTYTNQIILIDPSGKKIMIDRCIADEIQSLWNIGIRTVASCCGHNIIDATIVVDDKCISEMEHLGYDRNVYYKDIACYYAKSVKRKTYKAKQR